MKHKAMQGLIFVHNDRAGHWPAPRCIQKPNHLRKSFKHDPKFLYPLYQLVNVGIAIPQPSSSAAAVVLL